MRHSSLLGIILLSIIGSVRCVEIAVRLAQGTDPMRFAAQHRLTYICAIAGLRDHHLYAETEDTITDHELHAHPSRSIDVLWWEHQIHHQLSRRMQTVEDPIYSQQWHLHSTDVGLNVEPAWQLGYTGKGIKISILDDGLESDHPEFRGKYLPELSYDINGRQAVPILGIDDIHGTAAAGLAAGAANSHCGRGVAPSSSLAAVRLVSKPTSDADEAQAIAVGALHIHVYSASWGPVDDARRLEGPGRLASQVLEAMATGNPRYPELYSREGRGAIYVWAAGNGGKIGDNCNYDGWANSRYTITVASVTDEGQIPDYSENCAALLTSAPSSGGRNRIHTADISGTAGYSEDECTNRFSGTSASAPMIAGAVALMLEARPELGWRDVQHIIVRTSRPLPSDLGQKNGAGFYYSHSFGFGLLDVEKAVRLALVWDLVGNSTQLDYTAVIEQPITAAVTNQITVSELVSVEYVEIQFTALHPNRGRLCVLLVSPSGTLSTLAWAHRDDAADYKAWRFGSTACWGERSNGNWSLSVQDVSPAAEPRGVWESWTLRIWGE